jgi:hypothetical protein
MKLVKGIMIFALIAFLAVSCAKAPTVKIEEVKKAVVELKGDKEVSSYAKEALAQVEKSASDLDAELNVQNGKLFKSYVKTESIISEVMTEIDAAKKAVAPGKEDAKKEVKADLESLPKEIFAKDKKIADAKAKGLKIDYVAALATMTEAKKSLPEAKKDNDKGNFADAKDKLTAIKDKFKALDESIAAASTKK